MSDEDPVRLQQIRKFSAIYGRFDCKRRPEKPLTLHEVNKSHFVVNVCEISMQFLNCNMHTGVSERSSSPDL